MATHKKPAKGRKRAPQAQGILETGAKVALASAVPLGAELLATHYMPGKNWVKYGVRIASVIAGAFAFKKSKILSLGLVAEPMIATVADLVSMAGTKLPAPSAGPYYQPGLDPVMNMQPSLPSGDWSTDHLGSSIVSSFNRVNG